jgi:hypothetical protein
MFGFSKWDFRRGEQLWPIMHFMLNLDTQAIALQTARPIQLG